MDWSRGERSGLLCIPSFEVVRTSWIFASANSVRDLFFGWEKRQVCAWEFLTAAADGGRAARGRPREGTATLEWREL